MNRDEHDFIFELARTTPFSYVTLLGSFQSFCEHVKNKDTTMEVKMKSFRSVLKVSQATLVPLPNVVALVGRELRRKPSWFQRLKNWFVGIKNKIKNGGPGVNINSTQGATCHCTVMIVVCVTNALNVKNG